MSANETPAPEDIQTLRLPQPPPESPGWLSWGAVLVSGFLPGALAGTQIAGLLFFLNSHLPFGLNPMLRGIGLGGLLLGTLSLAVLWPFLWGRPGKALRWLPIHLTVVLAAAGVSAWIHASYFAFFLPPGINRRLLKAAILLSAAALICFYTVLLHRVRQRRYGRRSWTLFALMALASVYVVVERREAFRPYLRAAPRSTTFEGSVRPQVCVVGIDSATLDAILPLTEQEELPFFSKMLRDGSHYRLSSLFPARQSAGWATLATGKYPYRHGVLGERTFRVDFLQSGFDFRLLPLGFGLDSRKSGPLGRSVDSGTLRVRALWEILSRLGVPTGSVGWPLTSPLPEGVDISISERFFEEGAPTDVTSEDVFPEELTERARLFRTQLDEVDPTTTAPFGVDPPPEILESLVRDLWVRDLGIFLLEQNPQIEVFFLALPGLAEVSRNYFGGYHAVQFKGVQDPESARGSQLVSAYYAHLDELLSGLWEASREPRWLVVVSTQGASGYRGGRELWRRLTRRPALEGTTGGGADGVLMLLGEGFQADSTRRDAELVDLVPTLLYGLGFPIARDLDGAVLTTAFDTGFLARQPLTFVPSYETFAKPR